MLALNDLAQNFPAPAALPASLVRLLDYQNAVSGFYSGSFELDDSGTQSAYYWFDRDEHAAAQFAIFGHGGDGSLYGYWLYAGQALTTAPIVFLSSEGVDSTLLANTFDDFLALLSLGKKELGFAVSTPEYNIDTRIDDQLLHFRTWLKREFDIRVPDDRDAIVHATCDAHPDLETWIKQWGQQHFGFALTQPSSSAGG